MDRLRILLVDMPRLMGDIIEHRLIAEPDMTIAGRLASFEGLVAEARRTDPTLIVIGVNGGHEPPELVELFNAAPHTRVLGIETDAGEAHLYELRPYRVPLGEVTPSDVVDAIRAASQVPSPIVGGR